VVPADELESSVVVVLSSGTGEIEPAEDGSCVVVPVDSPVVGV
jgi:hypothetical protein